MVDREPHPRVLYLTTRDVATKRTGADNRAGYLYEGLRRSISVDLIYFDRSEEDQTHDRGTAVPYPRSELLAILSIRFLLTVIRAVRSEEYDAVVVSGIGAVTYGLVASLLARASFVFDDHNVEVHLARGDSIPRYLVVYVLERSACALAALVVVPTAETRTALTGWARGQIQIVTNGYDAETFTPDSDVVSDATPRLFYFGNYRYEPNVEAVEYIATQLCPRLDSAGVDAQIGVAGAGVEELPRSHRESERIQILGFVDDLPATIRAAELVIVPLQTGSGSRLKIIESLACGTPVVSTPIGAEGWPTDWKNLTVVELDEFAERTIELLDEATFERSELDEYARYSWQAQAERFAASVRSTI